ncbi:MAG TPA: branched-chain amino acid ABC transporter permease, partial [Crenalkalicoccus sp.]|nr:branched-chain amino acid ABC transporter permease [Crenalkalicoccus sp.]
AAAAGHAAAWPAGSAAAAALLLVVAVGAASYLLAVRRLREASPLLVTMVSIGIAIFTKGAVMVTLGKNPSGYPGPLGDALLRLGGGASVPAQTVIVLLACAGFVLALQLFFARSRTGLALRAAAADRDAAALVGVPVQRMVMLSFALAAAAGAVAGWAITPLTLIDYNQGTVLGFKGFSAAMLGGMGHPLGTVAGGLLLGVLEALAGYALSSRFKEAVAFLLLLAVLFWRPTGLFGSRQGERV